MKFVPDKNICAARIKTSLSEGFSGNKIQDFAFGFVAIQLDEHISIGICTTDTIGRLHRDFVKLQRFEALGE